VPTIALRPETAEDEPFLRRLTLAIRWNEFAAVPLDLAQKTALLNQQHDAQHGHYLKFYPDADFSIVESDGAPIGRFYLDRGKREHLLIDIALLPDQSGKGIGGALIDDMLAQAGRLGRIVALQVDPLNPARHLYLRKGFRDISQDGFHCLMHWTPEALFR
jgi:GNAT superfamily N-acetyltransferase